MIAMEQRSTQLDMLLTDRILRGLRRGRCMCDMLGGCMFGVEWSGVLAVVHEGKKLSRKEAEDLAGALAVQLPLSVLKRAAEIAESEEE